jgi:putative phage-type endonuclease
MAIVRRLKRMFENCNMIPTADMPRETWLAERRKGIGGSDAAAIVGLSPWATPYTVYMDKLGLLPEKEDSEAMRQGRDLEEYVAQRFTESTGKRVQRCNYMACSKQYPFARADIDRRVIGENAGLECKVTATLDIGQFHGVEFPERYYAQCVHYLAVTGAERWYLAVLVLGRGFFVFTLERNEAEIAALMAAEADFWEKVENQTPPDITGAEADTQAVGTVWADSENETVELFGMESLFQRLETAEETLRVAQKAKDEILNQLKEQMKTAERGSCGRYSCTWKTQERRTLDTKALREDYPDIPFDDYMNVSKSRPFRWKAAKE